MSVHNFRQLLRYRWKAKGRHGIHSPFVYDMVEHVLMDKGAITGSHNIRRRELPLKYENLENRIAQYYGCKTVQTENNGQASSEPDMLILPENADWQDAAKKYFAGADRLIVVAEQIHRTKEQTARWNLLCVESSVRMSLDLFGIGLLLFRKEFKEKQHFVLKY